MKNKNVLQGLIEYLDVRLIVDEHFQDSKIEEKVYIGSNTTNG